MAASMVAGSISGSSPWTLTTMPQGSCAADFGDAIGAADVVGARHHRGAAERPRPARAMRSSSVATITACTGERRGRAPIHVLDHRLAGDVSENFSGESGGAGTSRG